MLFNYFILSGILCLAYLILLGIIFRYWKLTSFFKPSASDQPVTRVSVIIAARNEESHILECVHSILNQNYPSHLYELIVVDDQSEDSTPDILEDIKDSRLRIMRLGVYRRTTIQGSKKKAVAYGVNHASGDLILTTDADCLLPPDWISLHAAEFVESGRSLRIAPVKTHAGHGWLSVFQELDFMNTFLIQAGGIRSGLFQLGSAANLSFTKSSFLQADPYSNNQHIASGDDLFLIRKLHKQDPESISVLKSTDSTVLTQPVSSVSQLFSQRLRWAGKLKRAGSPGLMFTSSLVWLCKTNLIASPLVALLSGSREYLWLSLGFLLVHFLMDFVFLWEASGFFKRRKLLWYFFPMEILFIIYLLFLGLISWLPVSLEWKDRKI